MEPQNKQQIIIYSESIAAHSKQNSGEHISLSPPAGSPGNSPDRSSVSSDRTTLTHGSSPREDKAVASPQEADSPQQNSLENHPLPTEAVVNWSVLEEPMAIVAKTDPGGPDGNSVEETSGGGSGRRRPRSRPSLSILKRTEREKMVKKFALGFRIFGFLFCLISFSVMAADRNLGWALDSFERYKEFRYCMSVNVIGFVYSGTQALDLSYNLATGKYIVQHQQQRRYYFDFAIDQIITYLLISASSSATTRIDDWQSNWGKDKFPNMASASVSMSFLAFVALAASSLISGYALCTSKSL
ncbi:CASP-like protein 4A3 [Forsythia ovata]|uniref:CASP-like protein n=1 Tax=Forsythia ovata TaxID=205694 RepID=A0ABD1UE89_9LAMI